MSVVSILQPSFLPWRGVFRLVARSDTFVFYDDVQFDKHGWRNRNRILENGDLRWITVPVRGSTVQRLNEVPIDWTGGWSSKLLKRLAQNYARAPFGRDSVDLLAKHLEQRPELLVDLTVPLTEEISSILFGHRTKFLRSSELAIDGGQTERLVKIVESLDGSCYLSGPAARDYLDEGCFTRRGLNVEWETYDFPSDGGAPHPQSSILDFLASYWGDSRTYIYESTGEMT